MFFSLRVRDDWKKARRSARFDGSIAIFAHFAATCGSKYVQGGCLSMTSESLASRETSKPDGCGSEWTIWLRARRPTRPGVEENASGGSRADEPAIRSIRIRRFIPNSF